MCLSKICEVVCIKKGDGVTPATAVSHIGFVIEHGQKYPIILTQEEAIQFVKGGLSSFVVKVKTGDNKSRQVSLAVVKSEDKEYLRADADIKFPDLLLSLPESKYSTEEMLFNNLLVKLSKYSYVKFSAILYYEKEGVKYLYSTPEITDFNHTDKCVNIVKTLMDKGSVQSIEMQGPPFKYGNRQEVGLHDFTWDFSGLADIYFAYVTYRGVFSKNRPEKYAFNYNGDKCPEVLRAVSELVRPDEPCFKCYSSLTPFGISRNQE